MFYDPNDAGGIGYMKRSVKDLRLDEVVLIVSFV